MQGALASARKKVRRVCTLWFASAPREIERAERPASCSSRSLRSSSSVQFLLLLDAIHFQSKRVSAKTQLVLWSSHFRKRFDKRPDAGEVRVFGTTGINEAAELRRSILH